MTLILSPNMTQPDPFYAALLSAHDGLSDAESQAYNARLVLILGNHIGDFKVLSQALDAAKVRSQGNGL